MDSRHVHLMRLVAAAVVAVAATGATVASYIWQGEHEVFVSVYFGVIVGLLSAWLTVLLLRMAGVPRLGVAEGKRESRGLRNPIDAVGVWYLSLALWKQLGLIIIAPQIVFTWWLVYQLRRGWFGPPAQPRHVTS